MATALALVQTASIEIRLAYRWVPVVGATRIEAVETVTWRKDWLVSKPCSSNDLAQ
jgi:hypothetical protein